jgi:transcriptional regulator with XRE-family HTH domain
LRKLRGMTQVELAERSCISRPTVQRIEAGHLQTQTVDALTAIAESLDVHLIALIDPWENNRPPQLARYLLDQWANATGTAVWLYESSSGGMSWAYDVISTDPAGEVLTLATFHDNNSARRFFEELAGSLAA